MTHDVTTLKKAWSAVACGVLLLLPTGAAAQTADIVTPPPNVILPNSNGVPPGQTASLEGGAYVARADDSSSNWYNPAAPATGLCSLWAPAPRRR